MNRDGVFNFISSILVLIAGLIIGFIILLISDASQAWPAFRTILTFGVGSARGMGDVLLQATPIIFTGLSVAFAFKTGLFNIGATGQFTFGAFVAIYIGIEFVFIPPWLRIIIMIVAAAIAGALWGAIPGLLKAYRNVHEVITCIMTNYIGMFAVNYMIINLGIFDQGRATTLPLPDSSNLPSLGMDRVFTEQIGNFTRYSNVNLGIVLAIVAAILVYIILEKTTFGYGLKACGFNSDAAKYAGISEKNKIVTSMVICGALAGIGGALTFMSGTGLSLRADNVLAPEGFMGISVAFLGLNNPIGVIFAGTLVSYLFLGGNRIQALGFSFEIMEIVVAVIIYFCAFVFLMKTFLAGKIKIGKSKKQQDIPQHDAAKEEEETE
ncbi:MAG: ABC transporter permease [Oscillospiraceae bacterium]|nr:ABC transporter permease [Oscillospiraceae bacterium]